MELVWLVFSWALLAVTFVFLAQRESKLRAIPAALGIVLLKLSLASVVIGFGYGLEPALWAGINSGPEQGMAQLGRLLGDSWYRLLTSGFLPASLGLTVATFAPNRRAGTQRAIVTVVLSLMAADVFWSVANNRPIDSLVFSLFSDVFGGIIAGLFVGWLAGRKPLPRAISPTKPEAAASV